MAYPDLKIWTSSMQLDTTQTAVLVHLKDGEPVPVTLINGKTTLYILKEMTRAELEAFYEVNTIKT
jgi:hypothetical protein